MKRIRPAPQGRAYRYQRRIAHITLILAERGKSGDAGPRHAGDARTVEAAPAKGKGKVSTAKVSSKKKVAAK
jgi:large subunit ribosomal protein L22